MKKRLAMYFVLLFSVAFCVPGLADSGLFPKSSTLFGVIMPDICFAIDREADKVETGRNGERLIFDNFTAEEYTAFDGYAYVEGLQLKNKTYKNGTLTVELEKDSAYITFEYNYEQQKASVFYPSGVRKERKKNKMNRAGSILPLISKTFGSQPMPSLGDAINRYPDKEIEKQDGSVEQIWNNVTDEGYEAFGVILAYSGASLLNYTMNKGVFIAQIGRNDRVFTFSYDPEALTATVIYPEDAYDERVNRAEKHYLAAKEFISKEQYAEGCKEIRKIQDCLLYKDSDSLLEVSYKAAIEMQESGKYEEASAIFEALGGYHSAGELLKKTQLLIALENSDKNTITIDDVNGFGGPVAVKLTLDQEGKIAIIEIGDSNFNETPGIGARALEPETAKAFIGLRPPLSLSEVDVLSGATITKKAILEAINKGAEILKNTFTMQALGLTGSFPVTVFLTKDGIIQSVLVGESDSESDKPFLAMANTREFLYQFVGKTFPVSVDVTTGATVSKNSIIRTVNQIIEKEFGKKTLEADAASEQLSNRISVQAKGLTGSFPVFVQFDEDGFIQSIILGESDSKSDRPFLAMVNTEEFLGQFAGKAAPVEGIDAVTGATTSSNAVVAAVNEAHERWQNIDEK